MRSWGKTVLARAHSARWVMGEGKHARDGLTQDGNHAFLPCRELLLVGGPRRSALPFPEQVLVGHPEYEVTSGSVDYKGESLLGLEPDERSHMGLFMRWAVWIEIEVSKLRCMVLDHITACLRRVSTPVQPVCLRPKDGDPPACPPQFPEPRGDPRRFQHRLPAHRHKRSEKRPGPEGPGSPRVLRFRHAQGVVWCVGSLLPWGDGDVALFPVGNRGVALLQWAFSP